MAQPSLADLTAAAAGTDTPGFPPASVPKFGGVDPLGLRQINFDIMDEILRGLNNVARHIRPFVVVAWAWRRANHLAQTKGLEKISLDVLQDFVDRIEVLFVWSQLLKDSKADLPGRTVLAGLLKAKEWKFGGSNWQDRRKIRKYSTALSAPINYGPGLKMLGWVQRHPKYPDIMIPTEAAVPALDAFEARMSKHLDHAAFSKFGSVTVTKDEALDWAGEWPMDSVTKAEAKVMADMLFGNEAPQRRQLTGEMLFKSANVAATADAQRLRSKVAGPPSKFAPPQHLQKTWEDFRRLQVRQLFRLSLEALFWWMLGNLEGRPKEIDALVVEFLGELPPSGKSPNAGAWLRTMTPSGVGPTELMTRIQEAMNNPDANDLAPAIIASLAFCLREISPGERRSERPDRLPLWRAREEAAVRKESPVEEFLRHVFESWILAQHVFWSVGRGLADARARGKTLLRLRAILDEGGWTLAPGASRGNPPVPTGDRLQTVVTLAQESGLVGPPKK
jgi:hypothetical protein